MKRYGKEFSFNDDEELWETITSYMDNKVREYCTSDMIETNNEFMAAYLRQDPGFVELLHGEFDITGIRIADMIDTDVLEIAKQIRESDTWDADLCRELCELAGLGDEYQFADAENFESVIYKAADILGVCIV